MSNRRVTENIIIEDANIGFRNFSGNEGPFNPVGRKNFCVFFDDVELAQVLESQGWNMRWLKPREEGDEPRPYLPVAVTYDNFPPKIVIITSRGKTILNGDTVNMLDWAEFKTVDMIIRPYNWEVSGKGGVKAYIKSMYITIIEDELEKKYAELDHSDLTRSPDDSNWDNESDN